MIKTDFKSYCEDCRYIEPEANQIFADFVTGEMKCETVISCKHEDACKNAIKRVVKKVGV